MGRRALPIDLSGQVAQISLEESAWRIGQATALLMKAMERKLSTEGVDNFIEQEQQAPHPKVGTL